MINHPFAHDSFRLWGFSAGFGDWVRLVGKNTESMAEPRHEAEHG